MNLLPSHPFNTQMSTFWTYINVPQITSELVYETMQEGLELSRLIIIRKGRENESK
jgi:hypothetical protein